MKTTAISIQIWCHLYDDVLSYIYIRVDTWNLCLLYVRGLNTHGAQQLSIEFSGHQGVQGHTLLKDMEGQPLGLILLRAINYFRILFHSSQHGPVLLFHRTGQQGLGLFWASRSHCRTCPLWGGRPRRTVGRFQSYGCLPQRSEMDS